MLRWLRTPRRKPAPGQVTLEDAVDLLALATSCLDHQINSSAAMLTTPKTLYQVGQLHRGERKLHLLPHSRQRLFDQPLPGSDEPILRAVLGVAYPFGYHLSPLLTRVHTMLPNLGTASASLARRPLTPLGGTLPSRQPQPRTRSPRSSSLPSAQYRSNAC